MIFHVVESNLLPSTSQPGTCYLTIDYWDDWKKYRTMFHLYIFDESGKRHSIGDVKIGQRGLKAGNQVSAGVRAPQLPQSFATLTEEFFSLGQTESYYEELNTLSTNVGSEVLRALRDVALDLDLFSEIESEDVTTESLLRHVRTENITGRLHRLSIGDATLTAFDFSFHVPDMVVEDSEEQTLHFSVKPDSMPPSNVHAVIGRNGVGKTRLIKHIVHNIISSGSGSDKGNLILQDQRGWSFSGIVSVSFSAFDELVISAYSPSGIPVSFVGLRSMNSDGEFSTKSPSQLIEDFSVSFQRCSSGMRRERWRNAIHGLYSDPVFADADPLSLLSEKEDECAPDPEAFFGRLSSGHKIVLLTVTKLVELMAEKTLVLLDEPEGHLHPPLLSALVRSLSRLLTNRNAIAVVATHSPVVLQEVPRDCTWIIHRSGKMSKAERPTIETFGENVGVLTREVFGLEVTDTGFVEMITKAAKSVHTYEQLLELFGQRLGTEARVIARGMLPSEQRTISR